MSICCPCRGPPVDRELGRVDRERRWELGRAIREHRCGQPGVRGSTRDGKPAQLETLLPLVSMDAGWGAPSAQHKPA
jgi:hypothetical protein